MPQPVAPPRIPQRPHYADTLERFGTTLRTGLAATFFSPAPPNSETEITAFRSHVARAIVAQSNPGQLFESLAMSVGGSKTWGRDLLLDMTPRSSTPATG